MTRNYLKKATPPTAATGAPTADVPSIVRNVIDNIRRDGDAAVRRYSEKFDKWTPASFKLSADDTERIVASVPKQTLDDIRTVQANVRKFAEAQHASLQNSRWRSSRASFWASSTTPLPQSALMFPADGTRCWHLHT